MLIARKVQGRVARTGLEKASNRLIIDISMLHLSSRSTLLLWQKMPSVKYAGLARINNWLNSGSELEICDLPMNHLAITGKGRNSGVFLPYEVGGVLRYLVRQHLP